MKRVVLFIYLITFILLITGCQKQERCCSITSKTVYDLYDIRFMNKGEIERLDIDFYAEEYEFNQVEFHLSDENVARVNYKEELIALESGRTRVQATLYQDNNQVVHINFGYIYIIDITDLNFTPINSYDELYDLINNNPKGYYYLNADIDVSDKKVSSIPNFNGILVNPNNYVIKGLTILGDYGDVGLFQNIDNAYIDGLILEDVNIKGKDGLTMYEDSVYVGSLVGRAINSYISNIHVTGNVQDGIYLGGIAGTIQNTALVNSSFKGSVSNGKYVAGIIGYMYDSRREGIVYTKIVNSYAVADLTGGYTKEGGTFRIAGIVTSTRGGLIKSTYFSGSINSIEGEEISPIGLTSYYYLYEDVYHTIDYDFETPLEYYFPEPNLNAIYISEERMRSGEPIEGLESFYFQDGQLPTNRKN